MTEAKIGAIGCAVIVVLGALGLAMCSPDAPPTKDVAAPAIVLPTYKPTVAPVDRFAIAAPTFEMCPKGDTLCEADRKTVPAEWAKAFRGDYQSQRNIAFIMSQGEFSPPVAVRMPIQGCAWRLVIAETQIDNYTDLDEKSMTQECGKLDAADRRAASIVAEKIMRRINRQAGPPAN